MNDTDRFESQHVSCAHTNFRVHGWLESYTVSTRKQIQINLYVRHETQVLIFALWWESGAVTTHVHLKKGAVRQWLGTLAIESQDPVSVKKLSSRPQRLLSFLGEPTCTIPPLEHRITHLLFKRWPRQMCEAYFYFQDFLSSWSSNCTVPISPGFSVHGCEASETRFILKSHDNGHATHEQS